MSIARQTQGKLDQKAISTRSGPNRQKVSYLQTSTVINLANGIFGYKGWSSSVTELWENYSEHINGRWSICYSAKVKVELQNGTFHEDVGTGSGLSGNRADALD